MRLNSNYGIELNSWPLRVKLSVMVFNCNGSLRLTWKKTGFLVEFHSHIVRFMLKVYLQQ